MIENVKDIEGRAYFQQANQDSQYGDPAVVETPKTVYQKNTDKAPRGWTEFLNNEPYRVVIGPNADASTAIHEFQHVFIDLALKARDIGPERIVDIDAWNQLAIDLKTLEKWAGGEDGVWTEATHERVAEAFEVYFMESKPPVEGLRKISQKMRDWLMDIYKGLKELNAPLSDEVREVFDRQLATDMELALDRVRLDEPEGLAPEISSALAPARDAARAAHEESVRTKRLAEVKKMKSQWRKEAGPEADNHPAHRMMDDIVARGGISAESLRNGGYNDPRYTRGLNRKRPGLVSEKGQLGFDEFAHEFQMDSDELVMGLLDAPTKKQLVEEYLDHKHVT